MPLLLAIVFIQGFLNYFLASFSWAFNRSLCYVVVKHLHGIIYLTNPPIILLIPPLSLPPLILKQHLVYRRVIWANVLGQPALLVHRLGHQGLLRPQHALDDLEVVGGDHQVKGGLKGLTAALGEVEEEGGGEGAGGPEGVVLGEGEEEGVMLVGEQAEVQGGEVLLVFSIDINALLN